ncbi:sodium channel modifier 1 isoform X2 [Salmo trutta]|uniref:sodium channel modifier 1 isoform X2 n=1 Tax=Salmo trutta TaxID=8032 RepID=UPI0011329EAA|nr:sodium channel modifier 1-like isoform X2 [Salmo trutta]
MSICIFPNSLSRYTCLVCSYRPVFDTVDMLTLHIKGKRHLEGMKWFYGKKTQLKNEISKRNHENYVQAEDSRQEPSSSAPLLTQTRKLTHHALLKTVPYNSWHKKTRLCSIPVTSALQHKTITTTSNVSGDDDKTSCHYPVPTVIPQSIGDRVQSGEIRKCVRRSLSQRRHRSRNL